MKNLVKSAMILCFVAITLLCPASLKLAGSGSALANQADVDILDFLPAIVAKRKALVAPALQISLVDGTSITLTWTFSGWPTSVDPNEGYRIEASGGPTGFHEIARIPGRASPQSLTITGVSVGFHYYRVRAFTSQGFSPYSYAAHTRLYAPVMQAPVVNGSQITLTWTFYPWFDLYDSNENYRIEESTSSADGPFTEIAQIPGPAAADQSQTIITRSPGTYYYRVRAFINSQTLIFSPYSNVVSTGTGAPVLQTPVVSGTTIPLTWTFNYWPSLVTANEGYRIEESTSSASGPFTEIAQIPGRASPQSQNITRNPGTYYYRVRAFINQTVGFSPYSNVVSAKVTTPGGPTTLRIINDLYDGTDQFGIDWSRLNNVISLRVGPTLDSVLSGTGAYELLQSSGTVYLVGDALQITPGYQEDFDVSSYGFSTQYYVLIDLGRWEPVCISYFCDWEKNYAAVTNCAGQVVANDKWVAIPVTPPFGNPEVCRLSDFLPQMNWLGSNFCP